MQTLLPIKGVSAKLNYFGYLPRVGRSTVFETSKGKCETHCLPPDSSESILMSAVFILQNATCIWWTLWMHVIFYAALPRTGFWWQLGKLATKDIKVDSKTWCYYHYYYSCGRKDFRNCRIHCEWCTARASL